MALKKTTLSIASFVVLVALAQAQNTLTAAEAKDHVGEKATICGAVVSTHFATSSRGTPTFLNIDKSYPNQVFTVLIWGSDRPKFGDPERAYSGKRICANGKISIFRGVPEVVAYEPAQIKVQ